jgi:phage gpG-like protein
MGIKVEVDTQGVTVMFQGLDAALADLTPVWGQIRRIYIDFIKEHFASQGSYTGEPWKPLSPRYAAWKAANGAGRGILRGLSDNLYGSLTSEGHAMQVFRTTPSWMEYGTQVFYGRIHQTGSISVQNRPPKRIVIPALTQAEGERVVDALLAHIYKRMRTG